MSASTDPYALVVDDDPLILMLACDILQDAGFRFFEACTDDEAKVVLEERAGSVTLLFSDVEMPGEANGLAPARHVAEHWPWIEIVIVSGRIAPRIGEMPSKATFIEKPFDHGTVHRDLREKLLDGKKPEPLKATYR